MPELPQALTFFLPALTISLSAWLSHNGLPPWENGVIVLIVTLLSAVIWAFITPPITHSLWADILIIGGYCVALTYGPLLPLYQELVKLLPSPLALFIQNVQGPLAAISRQSLVSKAVTPPTPQDWRATTQSWPAAQTANPNEVPSPPMPQVEAIPPSQEPSIVEKPEQTPPS